MELCMQKVGKLRDTKQWNRLLIFAKKGPTQIIFIVLMKNKIRPEYTPMMKVLIFADLMYFRIVNVENTQAQ